MENVLTCQRTFPNKNISGCKHQNNFLLKTTSLSSNITNLLKTTRNNRKPPPVSYGFIHRRLKPTAAQLHYARFIFHRCSLQTDHRRRQDQSAESATSSGRSHLFQFCQLLPIFWGPYNKWPTINR